MIISNWIARLSSHFGEVPASVVSKLQPEHQGVFFGLRDSLLQENLWEMQVAIEPAVRLTCSRADAISVNHADEKVQVFSAAELGWEIDESELTRFICPCGGSQFMLWLVFEPYEDAEEPDDMSWFWLTVQYVKCQHIHDVVSWELD